MPVLITGLCLLLACRAAAQAYPNIAGYYSATETYVINLTASDGEADTETNSGSNPSVYVSQTGNTFSITTTDPSSGISVTTSGVLSGNNIVSMSGPALGFQNVSGLVVTYNQITSGSGIVTQNQIQMSGTGRANVTYMGVTAQYDTQFALTLSGNVTPLAAPQITTQPQSQTNVTGITTMLSAVATGATPLIYHWQKNSTNLANGTHISGTTTNTLTITNLLTTDAGNYTVIISNSVGSVTSSIAALTVTAPVPLQITTASLPSGTTGVAYNQTLAATGGQTPYRWTNSVGTLPSGLTLATNGVISGKPVTNGTFNFTAKLTDALTATATQSLTLTILAPPRLTIIPAGANVILTWPTNATGFTLQSTTNLVSSTVWSTNLPSPIVVSTNYAVTNTISGTQKFYRLAQ